MFAWHEDLWMPLKEIFSFFFGKILLLTSSTFQSFSSSSCAFLHIQIAISQLCLFCFHALNSVMVPWFFTSLFIVLFFRFLLLLCNFFFLLSSANSFTLQLLLFFLFFLSRIKSSEWERERQQSSIFWLILTFCG